MCKSICKNLLTIKMNQGSSEFTKLTAGKKLVEASVYGDTFIINLT